MAVPKALVTNDSSSWLLFVRLLRLEGKQKSCDKGGLFIACYLSQFLLNNLSTTAKLS